MNVKKTIIYLYAVPVEIIPFGWSALRTRIEKQGARVQLRAKDGKTFLTDQGNWIYDCEFGPIDDPDNQGLKSLSSDDNSKS